MGPHKTADLSSLLTGSKREGSGNNKEVTDSQPHVSRVVCPSPPPRLPPKTASHDSSSRAIITQKREKGNNAFSILIISAEASFCLLSSTCSSIFLQAATGEAIQQKFSSSPILPPVAPAQLEQRAVRRSGPVPPVLLADLHPKRNRAERRGSPEMNNLFSSGTFTRSHSDRGGSGDLQMSAAAGANLDKFFEDVEGIKDELKEVERLHRALRESNDASKSAHDAAAVRSIRARMDADVALALKKAKLIKLRLEALDRANAANRSLPNCGPGSSTDRTRTSVVSGLRKKLKDSMDSFTALREQVATEYRETVGRRYYTVTGEAADEATLDTLISTGEAERMVQRVIREGGRGEVMAVVTEIRERHGAAMELERSLAELQQVFMDMAVLVTAQGEQLDDIESQVARANSFVRGGTQQLQTAKKHQKNTRKWTCFAIIILLIIILIIVLPIVLRK